MSENNINYRKRFIRRQHNPNHNIITDDSYSIFNNDDQQQQQQQQQQHRINYVRKKPDGLMCNICEGPAHGYNFDAITCESCKAFFRRNALKSNGKFKCRADDNQCTITITTRKRCKACRLAKCFEKGMRADWILTDEERINKKQKIDDNRRFRQMLYPDSPDTNESPFVESKTDSFEIDQDIEFSPVETPVILLSEDLTKIEHIQQAFIDSVRLTSLPPEIRPYPHIERLDDPWQMVNLPTNIQASRLITFYKLIPEFSSINEDDKLILIKYNIFALLFIRSALIYDILTDSYHEGGTDDCIFAGKDIIQCFSLHQYEQSTRCVRQIIDASQNDRVVLQILLIIMLFSKGASKCIYTDENEPIAQDILSMYHTQNIFIQLLWKYCENKFGFDKTIHMWLKLVTTTIDAHVQAYNTRHNYVKNDLVADQLVPLMKSIMLC